MRKAFVVTVKMVLLVEESGEASDFIGETLREMEEQHGGKYLLDWKHLHDPQEVSVEDKEKYAEGDAFAMTRAGKRFEPIPSDYPVQPLRDGEAAEDKCVCGHCGLSWDDGKVTSITPTPSGRCPFEPFHLYPE